MALSLERVLTSPKCFGLIEASPLQRALCRIIEGIPYDDLLEAHPELRAELATTLGPGGLERLEALPPGFPREVFLICGIRCAKSLFCAAIAFRATQIVDLSPLRPWEQAVVSVLSLTREKAQIVMGHLLGPLMQHAHLRALLPREPTASTIWIRRPHDGRIVRIRIAAGARAGGSLVGDWSAGCIFDEFPRMTGEDDGSVINFDESRKAVFGRLLPGAQLVGVGSPWAPDTAAHQIVKEYWGNPSRKILVMRPPSRAMNPAYWTDAKVAELRASPKGEHVYQTDYLGNFLHPASGFFGDTELVAATRKGVDGEPPAYDLPRRDDMQYFAAIDPAKSRNAFTLVIAGREFRADGSFRVVIVLARQWMPTPTAPLDSKVVMKAIAEICAGYFVYEVMTDGYLNEEVTRNGAEHGLTVTDYGLTGQDSVRLADALRLRVLNGGIELHPEPLFRQDLRSIRKIVRNRNIAIELPVTNDGRHADFAPPTLVVNDLAANAPGWQRAMGALADRGGRFN